MPAFAEDRLDSWKEIAAYLKRGVRTVRRWEREEGLPVHRHVHHVLASVYAYKSEIDMWQVSGQRHSTAPRSAAARRDGAATEEVASIAVLPFTNLSPPPDNDYFADGLTEEVTTDLSKISALRVISRTSAMTYKHTTKEVGTISRELGVRYLLEGSVRRAEDRLRIAARLIDAASDRHVWSETFDGTAADVFAFQERISRVIVDALEIRLTTAEDRRLADRAIVDVHAYECYLRARQEAWRWRHDAIAHAIQLLRNGLAIVGPNAKLYAALGHAHLQYREAGVDLSERPLDEAEHCMRQVFALDPASAPGVQLRAWIHYGRARIQEAVHDLKTALELEPNNPDTLLLLTNCYLISGQVPAARPLIDRLLLVDPLTPVSRCMRAFADAMEGNFAVAIDPYRQMFEMDPANPMARLFYVWVLVLNRRGDLARSVLEDFPEEVRDTVPARLAFFLARAAANNAAEASAAVTTRVEEVACTGADMFARMLAQGYAMAGMPERALFWLGTAVNRGFINYPFLAQHDPFFAALRREPGFEALMETVRNRWERFEP
jgi:TolB-like protein